MRKFGLALPMAGLTASVVGIMGGYLAGQPPQYVPDTNGPVLELLAPEFESAPPETFQTPVIELGTDAAVRSGLTVIEPRSLNPEATASLPLIIPGKTLNSSVPTSETARSEMPPAVVSPQRILPREPGWMQSLAQPMPEASLLSGPAGVVRKPAGLPPLPSPTHPRPGHSRARIPELPRPGHSAPKRMPDIGPDDRA